MIHIHVRVHVSKSIGLNKHSCDDGGLSVQEDVEGHLSGLHILQDLLSKNAPAFEDQFARLGLQLKIHALSGPPPDPSEEMEAVEESKGEDKGGGEGGDRGKKKEVAEGEDKIDGDGGKEPAMELEDATELAVFTPYQWREWSIVRSPDCLYMWNEFSSLELSNVSNGWFRFLIDNKLATMYSSGSTEGGPDSFGKTSVCCPHQFMFL